MGELDRVRELLVRLDQRGHSFKAPAGFADQVLFDEIDTDGSGDIDRKEWITFISKQARAIGERPIFQLMKTLRVEMDQNWSICR